MTDKNFLPPEDRRLADQLESLANRIAPRTDFERELEKRLMQSQTPESQKGFFAQALPALGWTVGLILLAVVLNFAIRTVVPPQPAAEGIATLEATPEPIIVSETIFPPSEETYDLHGTPLVLKTNLPNGPASAFVFNYQPEQHATLEDARALAAQFGMDGAVYRIRGDTIGLYPRDYLIVDGDQWLHVRSDQYFQYYPDYPRYVSSINAAQPPANAETVIDEFLKSHGFDFDYRLLPSEIYGGYVAAPLTPDGSLICYEYFKCAGLHFQLDEQGILYVDGILPNYEVIGEYGIISAEEALQKFLNSNGGAGVLEGMHPPTPPIPTWVRARSLDTTLTLYGYLASVPSAEGGAPLVTLDGIRVTGSTENIPPEYSPTFVEARGQLHEENGVKTFALESWKAYDGYEEGLLGTISQQNGQVVLNTVEGFVFTLPDIPADLPLPLDNAFVIGVPQGETFEWKSIDQRNVMGGGGAGGGGLGFYKLNLTGTPVPFPTPTPQIFGGGGGGGGATYTVQAGDTCRSIADAFNIPVEELMAVNNLPSDCSTLQIDQQLIIPGVSAPQKVEGVRGLMTITIYKQADGSQRVEYGFINNSSPFPYLTLEGENLEALQAYQNRPVDVWGMVETNEAGQPVLKVERYEIPFPDLQFQILRGTQTFITLNGQPATLFTTTDGKAYIQLTPDGGVDVSTVGNLDDPIEIEALIIPGESFGGYPVLRIFAAQMADSPQPLQVTADQIYTVDLAAAGEYVPPTMTIERVELVYYMPDPRYHVGEFEPDHLTLQPAWLFTGHYSDGTAFFILVQALKQEFLLPEIAPYTQPG
ncbi:MAG: LysM peptidoglycan-binding domain-containing protein [Chloroflexota bacterium]|nr:LysM peptidoglycan-binding domain-containing protein [Chloroflexota bacterium]MBI5704343.1 LysM peptidoglycan-binding domain-containing protein [Chloroflexota bacterium]